MVKLIKTLLHKAQKLQNFACKVAVGGRKYDHITPIIKELKLMSVSKKFTFDIAVTVFKLQYHLYPNWFIKLPTISEICNSKTRQNKDLYVPRTRLDCGGHSFKVLGPKV